MTAVFCLGRPGRCRWICTPSEAGLSGDGEAAVRRLLWDYSEEELAPAWTAYTGIHLTASRSRRWSWRAISRCWSCFTGRPAPLRTWRCACCRSSCPGAAGEDEKVMIVTATSGDTGKAALSGFQDAENIGITVFYPQGKVSDIQRLQMVTSREKCAASARSRKLRRCAMRGEGAVSKRASP